MKKILLQDSSKARILIRAANWVGDAIMTTPVVRAVRKNYPRAHITVLAKPWVIPVYENNPYLDEIMLYDNGGRHKKGMGVMRLSRDIRSHGFDLAILMQNAFEAGLLVFLAGIPERVGYNTDARTLLLNRSVRMNPALKKKHLIAYYIGILEGVGLKPDGMTPDLFISEKDKQFADQLITEKGLGHGMPVIGINPGATGGTAKRWFPERYAGLCRCLADRYKTGILIFGGPADHELGEEIASASGGSCINIAGKTSLSQAFALINACDLFVTNDSGLMHAAAALGIDQVAVIGSTDPVATAPFSDSSIMVRVPVPCSPCLKKECPIDHKCMDLISVDRVFQICQSILDPKTSTAISGEENPV